MKTYSSIGKETMEHSRTPNEASHPPSRDTCSATAPASGTRVAGKYQGSEYARNPAREETRLRITERRPTLDNPTSYFTYKGLAVWMTGLDTGGNQLEPLLVSCSVSQRAQTTKPGGQ